MHMAPKVTREYKQAVRDRVLKAVETLFSEKGYYDTSMDEIVAESGLSKGAIYGYFKSKEDLFVALQDKHLETSLDELRSTFAPSDSARTKLERIVDVAFTSMIGASKKACRISLEFDVAAPRMKSVERRREGRFKAVRDFLAEIIAEGVERGEFRQDVDADSAALILLAMADGLSLDWATTNLDFDWKVLAKQTKGLVAEGLLQSGLSAHAR
jgi:AcrR family transcriptional regulator